MHAIIIIPDLPELVIEQVQVTDEIILTLRTTSPTAFMPKLWNQLQAGAKSLYTQTA